MASTMNPASEPGLRLRKPKRGSRLAFFAVAGAFLLLVAGAVVALPHLTGPDLEYRFAAPEPWGEACLGGEAEADELLGWEEAGAPQPAIEDFEDSFSSYTCEWSWDPGGDGVTGQVLRLDVTVFDDTEPLGYDHLLEQPQDQRDWIVGAESLHGFDHGLCLDHASLTVPYFECMASDSNLELSVESRPATSRGDYSSDAFGPRPVSVEDLTVAVGELVQEAFRR
ncbi:hypothetical protein LO763_02215 [Glycomyces sp. A-F 0318]|uniref:hypothetical protein n=1 Tax=Glycomyces amatae TaxID=2881355 RepID=UPI001E2D349A|nr:hypothetical protein [Glycomyces amatae]MCD0442439.1 hypothetical protein [Glycomyces amatae]